jgi:Spy/CpxP family protein refolding chaperone
MRFARRAALAGLGSLGLLCFPLFAQEPAPKPAGETPKPAVRKFDPARRVPDYFGQIGLTPDQRETIYKARAPHIARIDELEAQIVEARKAMQQECEAVLTPSQKQLLEERRRAAIENRASARLAKTKAAEAKADGVASGSK